MNNYFHLTTNIIELPSSGRLIEDVDMDLIDKILIYTGCRPKTIKDKPEGRLLRILIKQDDGSFVSKENSNAGICGFFRMIDNTDNPIFDGIIAVTGADMNLSTGTSIAEGGIMTANFQNKNMLI